MWFHVKTTSSLFSSFIAALEHWKWVESGRGSPWVDCLRCDCWWWLPGLHVDWNWNIVMRKFGKWACFIHPGRWTRNIQITHLERKIIFQTSMIMFHANLQGCMHMFLYIPFRGALSAAHLPQEYEGDSRLPADRQSTYAMDELTGRELTSNLGEFFGENGRGLVNWWYCWWKKSCITWDRSNMINPVNNGINYLTTG